MLRSDEFNLIAGDAEKLFADLELDIIEEIAKRIMDTGIANSVVEHSILVAQQMGLTYEEIIRLISKYTGMTQARIRNILKKAGIASINYDDAIYKMAGKAPASFLKTAYLQEMLDATAKNTAFSLNNLVMTTAIDARDQLYHVLNKAYLEVTTGVKSTQQAILDAIDSIDGPYVIYPSGKKMSVEAATRMTVLTSTNQMCGRMQLARAKEMGCNLMELTAHIGARVTPRNDYTNHSWWQGHIVSIEGKYKNYLTLEDIGYGTIEGFKGINCRHDWRPYFEGLSRTYTQKELDQLKNAKVEYNGKKIGYYAATQKQRQMERTIRQNKKDIAKLKGILRSDNLEDREKVLQELNQKESLLRKHNSVLDDFCKQTGIRKDNSRLVIQD